MKGWITAVAALLIAAPALAEDTKEATGSAGSVNLESAQITKKHSASGRLDFRFFNEPEGIDYTSIGFRYGLAERVELGLRGTAASTRDFSVPAGGTISHGGNDLELFGKFGMSSSNRSALAGMVGVSFPGTPAQNRALATLGAVATFKMGDRAELLFNPRASLQEGNEIFGIGIGFDASLAKSLSVIADWTGIASGDNTRRTSDGSRTSRDIWGAALRWKSMSKQTEFAVDLGYGNAAGSTTGFSLTPGLGNSAAFYVAISARR